MLTDHRVAIKVLYKDCIRRGVTTDGRKVKENPETELRVMRFLGVPGHKHVLRLHNLLADDTRVYVVLEYAEGAYGAPVY